MRRGRRSVARSVGLSESADWEAIGRAVEDSARRGVSELIGAGPDADWPVIGQTADEKVRRFLRDLFAKEEDTVAKDEPPVNPWA